MCLRNMTREVCNGTKLIVRTLHNHLLDCEILTDPGKGKSISLPRITLIDNSKEETVILKRRQFPVALAYAMTIDKSQGQSLEYTGLILDTDCFAHGQLYTALSQPFNPLRFIACTPLLSNPVKVKNIVWKEVFPNTD
jgi:ATP-dependent DNA helicase PIF1